MPKRNKSSKTKANPVNGLMNFVVWLTGIVVSLSVGFAMIGGTLTVPYWLGGSLVSMIAGWIVVIATFVGVVTAIFGK